MRIDPVLFGQEQPLGEGEHLDREADVDCELEDESLAVVADVHWGAEHAQDWLDARVGILVATDHDRERSRLYLRGASRHRRVKHHRASSLLAHPLRKLTAHPRTDRAQIRPDLPLAQSGDEPLWACRD